MNWSASVLTGLTSDTEPTLLLTFDSAKYIFNAGENTQRAFLQSSQNWKRTRAAFLTSVGTQRASGLTGLLLTIADAGLGNIHVAGPSGLLHLLASTRRFAFRDTLAVHPIEVPNSSPGPGDPEPIYSDENILVYAIPITPTPDPSLRPTGSLKRKRPSPPPSPSKRFASTSLADHTRPLPPDGPSPSLRDLMRAETFKPQDLKGELAQEWRRELIRATFSGENAPQNPKKEKKKRRRESPAEKEQPAGPREEAESEAKEQGASRGAHALSTDDSGAKLLSRVQSMPGFDRPLPPLSRSRFPDAATTLVYVVVGPRVRGKFDVEKAKALGLPQGRIRERLARGETVSFMIDDGNGGEVERVVQPQDCIGKSEGRGVFLIIDTPTCAHIPPLVAAFSDPAFLRQFHKGGGLVESEYVLRTVFHLCGDSVLEDPAYIAFMNEFGSDVCHLVASRKHNHDPVTFTSAAFTTLRLNQLDPEMFPLPKFSLEAINNVAAVPGIPSKTWPMHSNTMVSFRPYRPPVKQEVTTKFDRFHPALQLPASSLLSPETLDKFTETRARVEEVSRSPDSPRSLGDGVTVISLGTGSAVPSKYRNVSGTLLQIPGWGNILLEAGEGTWGQLVRHFGRDHIRNVIQDLKCIFISHLHADHHVGLPKILSMRRRLLPLSNEPLYLIAHSSILQCLREYNHLESLGFDDRGVVPVLSDTLHWKRTGPKRNDCGDASTKEDSKFDSSSDLISAVCRALGLKRITTVDMLHRTKCFGVIFEHEDGWSIVYSGDTMPSNVLVREGENATLLIHEATMADDQVEMARAKAHSTFGQAMQVAKSMHAKNVFLTHFSARYPKMPPDAIVPPERVEEKGPTLGLAFDNARVKIGTMQKLNMYLPAIEQSFIDSVEEGDEDSNINIARVIDVDVE